MPYRTRRVIHKPDRYIYLEESYDRILDELNLELVNYREVLQDKDAELWKKAMKSDMESIYSNQV